jgi:hypothetical protein
MRFRVELAADQMSKWPHHSPVKLIQYIIFTKILMVFNPYFKKADGVYDRYGPENPSLQRPDDSFGGRDEKGHAVFGYGLTLWFKFGYVSGARRPPISNRMD